MQRSIAELTPGFDPLSHIEPHLSALSPDAFHLGKNCCVGCHQLVLESAQEDEFLRRYARWYAASADAVASGARLIARIEEVRSNDFLTEWTTQTDSLAFYKELRARFSAPGFYVLHVKPAEESLQHAEIALSNSQRSAAWIRSKLLKSGSAPDHPAYCEHHTNAP